MGDSLKLSKDKRHRSSSSLAGAGLDGTRSERKLDIRALIPEVDDHFAVAESRCDELQQKIDQVKVLKRKKKLNKRSITRVNEQPTLPENVPFIAVRTQPKKKVSQQAARLRRLDVPMNPTRGYLDPATVEQHRMLGQVWGYGQNYNQKNDLQSEQRPYSSSHQRRTHADGDCMVGHVDAPTEVACGQDDNFNEYSDTECFEQGPEEFLEALKNKKMDNRAQLNTLASRRKSNSVRNNERNNLKEVPKWIDSSIENSRPRVHTESVHRRSPTVARQPQQQQNNAQRQWTSEERPVVELFHKSRPINSPQPHQVPPSRLQYKKEDKRTKKARNVLKHEDQETAQSKVVLPPESKKTTEHRHPRHVKYRSRGYEMPTVASQMKQADVRYHWAVANRTNIPFVVSKSTAPSHNIGVNIQQVLNGLKIQQPLNGIPLTIAHHMGLGHVPTFGSAKSVHTQPSLDNREINAIKLGRRLLLLPSYKYMSYNRLLSLYREGDGMVPKFLRAISRPNYFYTSMYNLATNREDMDGATSKARSSIETKQHLAEYASLYREFELVERRLKESGHQPELDRRREELLRELAAREDHIRKLVQDTGPPTMPSDFNLVNLRASASTADDGYRHSTFKLNSGDHPQ